MTENKPKEKEIEYAEIDDSANVTADEQKKIDDAKIQYPIWKPTKEGQILKGYVHEVLEFPQLNDGKGSLLLNLRTDNEKFPMVGFWLNTVAQSQLIKITGKKPADTSFDEKAKIIKDVTDKLILIKYEGEVKSQKKGYKPYQNYTIVEI